MISPVSSSTPHAQPAPKTQAASQKAPQPKAQPAATDTVKLNSARAVVQEATETSVQTAREAASGDIQARNLQARQAAAKAQTK